LVVEEEFDASTVKGKPLRLGLILDDDGEMERLSRA
jgi:hypothetical protein